MIASRFTSNHSEYQFCCDDAIVVVYVDLFP